VQLGARQARRSSASSEHSIGARLESARCTARCPASATDHVRLSDLTAELDALVAERERLEAAWVEAAEMLEA
jgi:hypothetical protein